MIKPILKIEVPSEMPDDDIDKMTESLKAADVTQDYHVIAIRGTSDYFSFEIITAPDASIHKP